MLVVRVEMWPQGDHTKAYPISLATLACTGVAQRDEPSENVVVGERRYDVRLFKDVAFGGPSGPPLKDSQVWRQGSVQGHLPGPRGAWDLLGGALNTLLGPRLKKYRGSVVGTELPREPFWPEVGSYWKGRTYIGRVVAHVHLSAQLSFGDTATDDAPLERGVLLIYEDGAEGPGPRGQLRFQRPDDFTSTGSFVPYRGAVAAQREPWVPTAAGMQPILKRLMDDWWERVFFARSPG